LSFRIFLEFGSLDFTIDQNAVVSAEMVAVKPVKAFAMEVADF
jgi:hypothetical protein